MSKPIIVDLYCGAGGATKGYQDAGFSVIGVDIAPQPNYCGDLLTQGAEAIPPVYSSHVGLALRVHLWKTRVAA